jgi:hypothetical protein
VQPKSQAPNPCVIHRLCHNQACHSTTRTPQPFIGIGPGSLQTELPSSTKLVWIVQPCCAHQTAQNMGTTLRNSILPVSDTPTFSLRHPCKLQPVAVHLRPSPEQQKLSQCPCDLGGRLRRRSLTPGARDATHSTRSPSLCTSMSRGMQDELLNICEGYMKNTSIC